MGSDFPGRAQCPASPHTEGQCCYAQSGFMLELVHEGHGTAFLEILIDAHNLSEYNCSWWLFVLCSVQVL